LAGKYVCAVVVVLVYLDQGVEEPLCDGGELAYDLVVTGDEAQRGGRGKGVSGGQVTDEDGLVLAESTARCRLLGAEAARDEGVTLAELTCFALDDEALGVDHPERVVVRDVDPTAGGGGDAQDGFAVVVGERCDRFQFTV